ncbi:MAG: NB-ARC domain-containing protein, partial [Anaerolineae bacterium]
LDQCQVRDLLPDLLAEIQAYKPTGSRLAPGVPFQAPPLPAHFVPRPEVSSALQSHLLAQETTTPGTLVISAVHGLGGIGKTTLVAELSRRRELRSRFPDGLLWATLGQEPQVLAQLHEWIQSLGDRDFHPTTVDGASAHLRTLLYDKACLLVLDDAWQADHVRPFLVGGEVCRVLITTRDATLARKVGARLYDLDVMTEAQSLALFEARLGSLDGQRAQAAELARQLGYLPLALELAAAQVEEGFPWTELLEAFRDGLAALDLLDLDDAAYRNESLRLSFRLSLDQLTPEEQEAFAWLGLLAEDALLNARMAATLWSLPEASARKRLHRFRNKALLRQAGEEWYGIHDLLRDEARLRLVEQMPLLQADAAYLERYRARTCQGQWHTVPDDGYIHEHLVWHMEQAGQLDQIHALLAEQTLEHRCGWYEVRERLGQTAGYLADVARAWRLAEAQPEGLGIGRQCRYALITASLNSVAANMPADLLELLAERRTWPPLRCLAYASQKPDLEGRAWALTRLAPYLP